MKISREEFRKAKLPRWVYDRQGNAYEIHWHLSKYGQAYFGSYRFTKPA